MMTAAGRLALRHPGWLRAALVLVLVAVAASVPQLGTAFYVSLVLNFMIFGLLAMSLDLLGGYTGLVSLGQASFLGVGAYGIAWALKQGVDPTASIGVALLAVIVTALAFGVVAVRVGGITFVILTLALGQIIWGLAYRWVTVSGGDNGLPVAGRPAIGPFDLTDNVSFYYFVMAVFLVCAVIMRAIVGSPFGLSLKGIKDNEQRMRTLGYRTWLHKYLAFAISAFFAGVAGVLFAFFNLYVSPTSIDFPHNGTVVLMAVLGGLGSLWGPLVGAIVIVFLQQYVSIEVQRWVTVEGVIFVLAVLFAREGLWGLFVRSSHWLGRRAGALPGVETAARTEAVGAGSVKEDVTGSLGDQ